MLPIIAMIASAALNHYTQTRAAKQQKAEALAAQQRQLNAQNEATAAAGKKASEFDPTQRRDKQQEIAQALTGELEQQVAGPQLTAQGVEVGSTIPDAQGTTEYLTAKARETARTQASLRELAALMGRIGSAGELRRQEATGIGDTAGQIGRIQSGANVMSGIDQVGIQAAGQPNAGMSLASDALRAYGAYTMGGAGGGKPKYPDFGKPSGPTGAWL
jgi:hypothetical protein